MAVKDQMIERGERDEPKQPMAHTQKERNLIVKEQLKKEKEKEDEKGKSKSSK